jgi:mono/diheme cytochrome c family protein
MMIARMTMISAGALVILAATLPARGAEPGNITAGRRLSVNDCGACHAIGTRPASRPGAAPAFAAIANMKSTTALSLRAFLQTPHGRMPDLVLSREESDDIIAYILSLRGS